MREGRRYSTATCLVDAQDVLANEVAKARAVRRDALEKKVAVLRSELTSSRDSERQ